VRKQVLEQLHFDEMKNTGLGLTTDFGHTQMNTPQLDTAWAGGLYWIVAAGPFGAPGEGGSRHINYFGDLVWVSAYALLTRNPWSIVIPMLLFVFFRLYNAPQLDRHLREKYPEFAAYERTTKMIIPFVL
jgi:protein-S-isoprenylcysteine O-methyltransferase Ste14